MTESWRRRVTVPSRGGWFWHDRLVEYDPVAAIYVVPMEDGVSVPLVSDFPARRLRDALEPIATQALAASLDEPAGRGRVADGRPTDKGTRARRAIEDATDAAQQALIAPLRDRVEQVIEWAGPLSPRIVEQQCFRTDSRKRAAG
jgi:hypothetical protein